MGRQIEKQEGQSLVLIALLMVGMIAFTGLLIDGGRDYAARRQAQNAADAAALAGTRALTTRPSNVDNGPDNGASSDAAVRDAVLTFAQANGVENDADVEAYYLSSSLAQGSPVGGGAIAPDDAVGVRVYVTIRFQPLLMTILGGSGPVAARAVAAMQSGPPTMLDDLMPVIVKDREFVFDQEYPLWGDDIDRPGAGNFGWIAYDCDNSESAMAEYLYQPPAWPTIMKSSGNVQTNSWLCGVPGTKVGNSIKTAMDLWLEQVENQRRWIIPIYDVCDGCNGTNMMYHVVKFAEFLITDYDMSGNPKGITGKFQKYTTPGHVRYPGPCNTQGDNACAMSMIQ